MELTQLQYLKEVARLESFSRAAETLHITQSALSKSIAKLEDEIGVKLFERQGNSIHLNQFGSILLRYSDQALVSLESGLSQVRNMAGLETGSVRVGVCTDVFIKHLVRDFLFRHPGTSLRCLLQSKEQMVESLTEGTIDFCVTTAPLPGSNLLWQPLYEDQITILVEAHHPLADRKSVFLDELSTDRFIITNLGYGMRSTTYDLCRMAGFEPKILYEGHDTDIASQLLGAGLAVEIASHSISAGVARALNQPEHPPIREIPLADSFSARTIGIVATRGHYQSPAALEFYSDVVDFYASLSQV